MKTYRTLNSECPNHPAMLKTHSQRLHIQEARYKPVKKNTLTQSPDPAAAKHTHKSNTNTPSYGRWVEEKALAAFNLAQVLRRPKLSRHQVLFSRHSCEVFLPCSVLWLLPSSQSVQHQHCLRHHGIFPSYPLPPFPLLQFVGEDGESDLVLPITTPVSECGYVFCISSTPTQTQQKQTLPPQLSVPNVNIWWILLGFQSPC